MELRHIRRVLFWAAAGVVIAVALDAPFVVAVVIALIAALIPEITG